MKSIFWHRHIWILLFPCMFFSACGDFEKEVEIDLPKFNSQLVIEAYVEKNKPIKLALSETQNYFGSLGWPFVSGAEIVFTYKGISYPFQEVNMLDVNNRKFYNYALKDSFNFLPGDVIYLSVKDSTGRMATAESRWLEPIKIDSVNHSFGGAADPEALITAHFKDPGETENFYRFRVVNLSDSNRVIQDFFTADGALNGTNMAFGTGFRFVKDDTLEVSLYNLPKDFYTFLETASAASNSNGNPFGQPSAITSNIIGGTGIFTVLPFDRRIYIIP